MKDINIEELCHSYIQNGMIEDWKLDLIMKEEGVYECTFTNISTGQKDVKVVERSQNNSINNMVEAIFCD